MAISLTSPPVVFIACCTACEPRPPQPTRPSLIVSLPKACAPRATCTWLAAMAEPAMTSEELRRNVRREVELAGAGEAVIRGVSKGWTGRFLGSHASGRIARRRGVLRLTRGVMGCNQRELAAAGFRPSFRRVWQILARRQSWPRFADRCRRQVGHWAGRRLTMVAEVYLPAIVCIPTMETAARGPSLL